MSRSQPSTHNHTYGPSRGNHGRDHVRSHDSSRHSNGNGNNQQTSSGNAGSSQQPTYGANGYSSQHSNNPSQDPRNGQTQYGGYDEYGRYIPVPRPWRHQNPEIDRVINHPALNVASQPNAQQYASHHAPPPAPPSPPPPHQAFPPNNRNTYRLTSANLQVHDQNRPPRNTLRRLERQGQRAGPYDAVGRIRRDGQVYEEDAEWSDGYHDYDA